VKGKRMTNREFFTKHQAAFHDEHERILGLDLYLRFLKLVKSKQADSALFKRYRDQLAAKFGTTEFVTISLKFKLGKEVTPPPDEPEGVLQELLEIAKENQSPRSNAALALVNLLVTSRIERKFFS
jgi:hypothetical protein